MQFRIETIENNFDLFKNELEEFCKKAEMETVLSKTKNNMRFSNWID